MNDTKDGSPKRLLNEVLPDPELNRAPRRGTPRERALEHLKKIVTTATTAGLALHMKACIGYGVVDPMPPPVTCSDGEIEAEHEEALWGDGHFVLTEEQRLVLEITFGFYGEPEGIAFTDMVTATGGTVHSARPSDDGRSLVVQIVPDEGATAVDGEAVMGCTGDAAPLFQYQATFTAPADEATPVTVNIAY